MDNGWEWICNVSWRRAQARHQGSKQESNTRTFFQLALFSAMNFKCLSAV